MCRGNRWPEQQVAGATGAGATCGRAADSGKCFTGSGETGTSKTATEICFDHLSLHYCCNIGSSFLEFLPVVLKFQRNLILCITMQIICTVSHHIVPVVSLCVSAVCGE